MKQVPCVRRGIVPGTGGSRPTRSLADPRKKALCFKMVFLRHKRASESPGMVIKYANALSSPQEILIVLCGAQEPAVSPSSTGILIQVIHRVHPLEEKMLREDNERSSSRLDDPVPAEH